MKYPSYHNLPDLIRAIHILAPLDELTFKSIMEIMGFEYSTSEKVSEIKIHDETKKQPSIEYIDSSKQKNEQDIKKEALNKTEDDSKYDIRKPLDESPPSQLEFLGKSENKEWFKSPPLDLNENTSSSTIYPIETLFQPNWTRSILSGALSEYCDFGPIDINDIVQRIASAEPLKKIHRIPYFTMAHGVQVLIDDSEALEPFIGDQTLLEKAIGKVAGQDRTQFLEFIGCPSWGVRTEKFEDLSDYIHPPIGSMVLLLTDLGITRSSRLTGGAGIKDWLDFANIVKKAGCSLVAFVPYSCDRWPEPLRNAMMIIEWDRKTSAITVKQNVRKKLRFKRKHNNNV